MHGTLEKKVPRPFGLAAWQPRDVSLEEDALVVELVNKHGAKKWNLIASMLPPGRSGKQCRERWHNQLNPVSNCKQPWSEHEDRIRISGHGHQCEALRKRCTTIYRHAACVAAIAFQSLFSRFARGAPYSGPVFARSCVLPSHATGTGLCGAWGRGKIIVNFENRWEMSKSCRIRAGRLGGHEQAGSGIRGRSNCTPG